MIRPARRHEPIKVFDECRPSRCNCVEKRQALDSVAKLKGQFGRDDATPVMSDDPYFFPTHRVDKVCDVGCELHPCKSARIAWLISLAVAPCIDRVQSEPVRQ